MCATVRTLTSAGANINARTGESGATALFTLCENYAKTESLYRRQPDLSPYTSLKPVYPMRLSWSRVEFLEFLVREAGAELGLGARYRMRGWAVCTPVEVLAEVDEAGMW